MGLGTGGAFYSPPPPGAMLGGPGLPSGARSPMPGPPYSGFAPAYSGAAPPFAPAAGGCADGIPSPFPGSAPVPFHGPPSGPAPGASFLNLFGDSQLTLQEIADKARQLQQKIDENAEHEKANLRASAEQKHQEIERHAAELARHAAGSIEAYKTTQLQTAERQKAYQQAVVRQQAEQAKRLIDQQAAQAIAAVETRDRQLDLQRHTQDIGQRPPLTAHGGVYAPPPSGGAGGGGLAPPAVAMLQSGIPVTAADAERCGSLGAAAASQLQSSESYTGLRPASMPSPGGYGGGGLTLPPAACGGISYS